MCQGAGDGDVQRRHAEGRRYRDLVKNLWSFGVFNKLSGLVLWNVILCSHDMSVVKSIKQITILSGINITMFGWCLGTLEHESYLPNVVNANTKSLILFKVVESTAQVADLQNLPNSFYRFGQTAQSQQHHLSSKDLGEELYKSRAQ